MRRAAAHRAPGHDDPLPALTFPDCAPEDCADEDVIAGLLRQREDPAVLAAQAEGDERAARWRR